MNTDSLPILPASAPFTAEQRGWLNGYLAAILGGTGSPPGGAPSGSPPPGPGITILWGSQTGNAEGLAKTTAKHLAAAGYQATVQDMIDYPGEQLASEEVVLVITSTYGDGEPPDNAADFHEFLHGGDAPKLDGIRFAVLALGDREYPEFCKCGHQFDARLEDLGATRLGPCVEADVDYDEPFTTWQDALVAQLPACVPA